MTGSLPARLARRPARLLGTCALALAASAGVAAAQSSAATISIGVPCVVYDQATVTNGVPFTASGFTANDGLSLSSSPTGADGFATLDGSGSAASTFDPPSVPITPTTHTFTLGATDDDNVSATTTFTETALAVDTVPHKAKPTATVTFNFSGFTPGQPVYGHYLHGSKVVTTKRYGTAAGPCGLLTVKSKFFPGKERYQSYKLQFDDAATYSKTSQPQIATTLTKTAF